MVQAKVRGGSPGGNNRPRRRRFEAFKTDGDRGTVNNGLVN